MHTLGKLLWLCSLRFIAVQRQDAVSRTTASNRAAAPHLAARRLTKGLLPVLPPSERPLLLGGRACRFPLPHLSLVHRLHLLLFHSKKSMRHCTATPGDARTLQTGVATDCLQLSPWYSCAAPNLMCFHLYSIMSVFSFRAMLNAPGLAQTPRDWGRAARRQWPSASGWSAHPAGRPAACGSGSSRCPPHPRSPGSSSPARGAELSIACACKRPVFAAAACGANAHGAMAVIS